MYVVNRRKERRALSLFNDTGWYRVMLPDDAQVGKALGLFPEAEKMALAPTPAGGK